MSNTHEHRPTVLITGGTKGIGLAIAKSFAKANYRCVLTYGWGSVEEEEIMETFRSESLPEPFIWQANVASPEDTEDLMNELAERYSRIDAFISNVSFCSLVNNIEEYSEKGLFKSIEYSTWPLIQYPSQMQKTFGSFPKYIIGLSSYGIDTAFTRYDFVAASKVIMEVLVKYLNRHFLDEDIIFNIVRTRPVITDSLISTLGEGCKAFIEKHDFAGTEVGLDEIGSAILMLCSGLMDGIRGQTLTIDKGFAFTDGIIGLYNEINALA